MPGGGAFRHSGGCARIAGWRQGQSGLVLMPKGDLLRGAVYGIAAASIWGGMYVVSDLALTVIPPFTLLSMRIALGLLALLPFALRTGRSLPDRRQVFSMLGVGVIGIGISLGAQFIGTDLSTAVNGALVTSASPAFVVLFGLLILRERLSPPRALAILMATAGVLVILDPAGADFGSDTFVGDVFLAIAALTWGLYSVLVRRLTLGRGGPTLVVTVFALLGGLILSLPASLLELSAEHLPPLDAGVVAGVLYLGLASTALALLLWNRAFALVPATVASLFFFAQPLTGALLAAVFLGQAMTAELALGGGLILAGVAISMWRTSPD